MLCICDKYLLCLVCIGFAYIIYILKIPIILCFSMTTITFLTDTSICNSYTWYHSYMYIKPTVCKPSADFIVVLFKMVC